MVRAMGENTRACGRTLFKKEGKDIGKRSFTKF